jgi:hypothetical protein
MSSFEKLVEIFERRGFTGKEAIEKAEAKEAIEKAEAKEAIEKAEAKDARDFNVELERIKLEQMKLSGMNTGES